jgi:hypothetical protein
MKWPEVCTREYHKQPVLPRISGWTLGREAGQALREERGARAKIEKNDNTE